jgi:hypothetical protein
MTVPLIEIAGVIRSKNAGPATLTLDIIFKSPEWFERASAAIDPATIARLYGRSEQEIAIIPFRAANAVKITMPRRTVSGDPGDNDVYGAQQHAPLLGLLLNLD